MSARGHLGAGTGGERCRVPRRRDLAAEHFGDERLDRLIGGVEHDQTVSAEQRLDPAGERIGHANPRPVGGAERFEQPGRELGLRQCGCQLVERAVDTFVELERTHRPFTSTLRRRHRDRPRLQLRVEDGDAGDLLPVVILGGHPEDRHDRRAERLRRTARQLNRADRFQNGVKRTAEYPGLLAGDDGDGLGFGEKSGSGLCGLGCVAAALLRGDCRRHLITISGLLPDACADFTPRVG